MFSEIKLIVLLLICETVICQDGRFTYNANQQGRTYTKNDSGHQNQQIFIMNDSHNDLFQRLHNDTRRGEHIREILNLKDSGLDEVNKTKKSFHQESTINTQHKIISNVHNANIHKPALTLDGITPDPKCKEAGKSFCTEVQDYPATALSINLKNQPGHFDLLFGSGDLPDLVNISQRNDPGEESLCTSIERVIRPQAGETKDEKWQFIVNQENYTQAVKIEECVNPDGKCMFSDIFPNNYTVKCKQNFAYRQLVAATKTGETFTDLFKLPSCCKCYYTLG